MFGTCLQKQLSNNCTRLRLVSNSSVLLDFLFIFLFPVEFPSSVLRSFVHIQLWFLSLVFLCYHCAKVLHCPTLAYLPTLAPFNNVYFCPCVTLPGRCLHRSPQRHAVSMRATSLSKMTSPHYHDVK